MTTHSSSQLRSFRIGSFPVVLAVILVLSSGVLRGVTVGATYDQVITEKGRPANKLELGSKMILTYPDLIIKLQEGRVISIKTPVKEISAEALIAPGQWTTDYAAALNLAKAQKRKVFLLFTGSDWCPWCKRLDSEVLSTPAFVGYAKTNLILVKLDFPRETYQAQQVAAQNQKLQDQYRVGGFPHVVILNDAGQTVGELGYQPGGPSPFIDQLKGM